MIEFSIDQPNPASASAVNGWIEVTGWAAGTEPIEAIHAGMSGLSPVRARYGGNRQDVAAARPNYPFALYSGFGCHVPVPARRTEDLVLEVEVLGRSGGRSEARINLNVTSNTTMQVPENPACPGCGFRGTACQSRFQHGPYNLHTCGHCGLGFVQPLPSQDFLKRYYDGVYWQSAVQRPHNDAEHYDSAFLADLLRSHDASTRRVLEIGCGPGTLLAGLRRRGFEVLGQDYSAEAAKIAKEVFGIDVRVAPLSDPPDWPCDAIVLRHVIEHSPGPCEDLARVAATLRPGGLLVIITPNLDSLPAQLLGASWEWFVPPAHLFYFSPKSLSHFAARNGLGVRGLVTRRGDGMPYAPAIKAYFDYEKASLPGWQLARIQSTLELFGQTTDADRALASLGLGNEVIAVLSRPAE
jgi:SAM-dependent methyltransferase